KIEGRLKSPEWVAKAVKLVKKFRDDLDTGDDGISELGSYAGREITDYYYLGIRDNLTADAGREKSYFQLPFSSDKRNSISILILEATGANKVVIIFSPFQGIEFKEEVLIKKKDYSRKKNLMGFNDFQENIESKYNTFEISIDAPSDILLTSSDYKRIVSKISAVIEKSKKPQRDIVKITLPSELVNRIKSTIAPCEFRRGRFGFELLRIFPEELKLFDKFDFDFKFIIECKRIADAKFAKSLMKDFIIALPEVFYEKDIQEMSLIIDFCRENKILLEINNLDALGLFEYNSIQWAAGPGLMILNSLAGDFLKAKGASYAVISMEADKEKVSDLVMASKIPLVLYVFGRPKLMLSRARISEKDIKISEKRGCHLNLLNREGFSIIYPELPFRLDISKNINAIFAMDLTFSSDPLSEIHEWQNLPAGNFNFLSKLK
ncbi:MAG TPA: hypothetical protein P5270_02805, partial [Victivallales bacterium]|nr:hypothetical protein [Victivallales bacterium]